QERAYHEDAHLYGAPTIEHCRCHDSAVLREGERSVLDVGLPSLRSQIVTLNAAAPNGHNHSRDGGGRFRAHATKLLWLDGDSLTRRPLSVPFSRGGSHGTIAYQLSPASPV